MMRTRIEGLTIRAALILGFGLTLGLWLFAGYWFTHRMAEVQSQAAAINTRYMRAQDLLSAVRAQVLLGSVYVRDALLDPQPSTIASYRQRLEETYTAVNASLQGYEPVLDTSAERERLQRLQNEINDFRRTLEGVMASDNTHWRNDARDILNRDVVPKREVVIRVSEEVQALNRAAFVQQQATLAGIYEATQRQIWIQLGFALLASLGIALFATRHVGRLEDRLHRQRERDAQNTRDLQALSAKLITAQEEERRRIARELHDEVGQVLTAIKLELAIAERRLSAGGMNEGLLEDAQSIADGALNTVRDLSHLLHPALLDDLGLPAAIDWYLRGFGKRYDIRVELLHEGLEERLSAETEAAAFRIVQEALTNVAKHAQASSCRVYLQRLATTVLITIEDDGLGFDPSVRKLTDRRGLGLIGIRERVMTLRGTLRLESSPGRGTRLTVELPMQPRQPAEGDSTSTLTPEVTVG